MEQVRQWRQQAWAELRVAVMEMAERLARECCGRERPDTPAVSLAVTTAADAVVVRAWIPLVDPASVRLAVRGGALELTAETVWRGADGTAWLRRTTGASIPLPAAVDAGAATAKWQGGCLVVTLPRSDRGPRRIPVCTSCLEDASHVV